MKLVLETAAPDVHALKTELARALPRYRYAIRTGRLHQFLVVGDDSSATAAIVRSNGKRIRIFGGFRSDWLQFAWLVSFYVAAGNCIAAVVAALVFLGGSDQIAASMRARVSNVPSLVVDLATLGLVVAWLVLWRGKQRLLVREVAAELARNRV